MSLVECKTAEEVIENWKAVRARTQAWRQPKPADPVPISIPIAEVLEKAPSLNSQPPFIPPIPLQTGFTSMMGLPLQIKAIVAAVAASFGVSPADIKTKQRTHLLVVPRHVCMHLARKLTARTLNEIGNALGGMDHTSIIHGARKIEKRRRADPAFDQKIYEIEAALSACMPRPA